MADDTDDKNNTGLPHRKEDGEGGDIARPVADRNNGAMGNTPSAPIGFETKAESNSGARLTPKQAMDEIEAKTVLINKHVMFIADLGKATPPDLTQIKRYMDLIVVNIQEVVTIAEQNNLPISGEVLRSLTEGSVAVLHTNKDLMENSYNTRFENKVIYEGQEFESVEELSKMLVVKLKEQEEIAKARYEKWAESADRFIENNDIRHIEDEELAGLTEEAHQHYFMQCIVDNVILKKLVGNMEHEASEIEKSVVTRAKLHHRLRDEEIQTAEDILAIRRESIENGGNLHEDQDFNELCEDAEHCVRRKQDIVAKQEVIIKNDRNIKRIAESGVSLGKDLNIADEAIAVEVGRQCDRSGLEGLDRKELVAIVQETAANKIAEANLHADKNLANRQDVAVKEQAIDEFCQSIADDTDIEYKDKNIDKFLTQLCKQQDKEELREIWSAFKEAFPERAVEIENEIKNEPKNIDQAIDKKASGRRIEESSDIIEKTTRKSSETAKEMEKQQITETDKTAKTFAEKLKDTRSQQPVRDPGGR